MIFLVGVAVGVGLSESVVAETTAVNCDTALELKARILYQYFLAAISPLFVKLVAFAPVLAMSEKCVPSRERATRKPVSLSLLSRQLSRICVEEIGVALRLLGAFSALLSAV